MANPCVVVIDDSPEMLDLFSEILGDAGPYEVRPLVGEFATVGDIAAARPNLVVIDLRIGAATDAGWTLLSQIRASENGLAQVPVVVCTADVLGLHDLQPDLDALADVHLLELPFTLDGLEGLVQRLTSVPSH